MTLGALTTFRTNGRFSRSGSHLSIILLLYGRPSLMQTLQDWRPEPFCVDYNNGQVKTLHTVERIVAIFFDSE